MEGILFSHFEEVDIGNEEIAIIVTTKINETTWKCGSHLKIKMKSKWLKRLLHGR
jgi:hypothetical protein